MKKEKKPVINGLWLEEALKEQGYNLHSASKLIGVNRGLLYAHKTGRITISTKVLFELCTAIPNLSERYILTGRGPKSLPLEDNPATGEKVLLESIQIKQSIDRIIAALTS